MHWEENRFFSLSVLNNNVNKIYPGKSPISSWGGGVGVR